MEKETEETFPKKKLLFFWLTESLNLIVIPFEILFIVFLIFHFILFALYM